MKGLIYKEFLISKKYMFLSSLIYVMFYILCLLIRLSMVCGNIAKNPENCEHLLNNLWIFQYLPVIILAISYVPINTVYQDNDSGFMRFCWTTSLSGKQIVGPKMLMLFIVQAAAFVIDMIAVAVLCMVGNDPFTLDIVQNTATLLLFISDLMLLGMTASFFIKTKKVFETAAVIVLLLVPYAFLPKVIQSFEKYEGRTDIDILDILRIEFAPVEKYIMPVALAAFVVLALICFFVGSYAVRRRDS